MHGVKSNCPRYNELYTWWVDENDQEKRAMYSRWAQEHRASCPTCRRETAELTELAKRAQMPEIELEEV